MTKFICLIQFTEEGLRNIKDSPSRAEAFRGEVEAAGGRVREIFWTLGRFDGVVILEARDELSATALLLALSQKGFVRTESLRAFESEEFGAILKQVRKG